MNIALVVPPFSGRGGVEAVTRNLVAGFQELGENVFLLGLGESTMDGSWHNGLPWTQIAEAKGNQLQQLLAFSRALARELKSRQPDVLIAPTASAILVCKLANLLVGVSCPVLSWLHFNLQTVNWKWLLPYADGHVAIGLGVYEELKAYLKSGSRIFLVPNGIDLKVPLAERSQEPEPVEFVYIGRLFVDKQKRVNDILQAVARLHGDARVTFVGDGPDASELKALAAQLGIQDQVTWAGWQSDAWSTIGKADAVLLASSYEGFPTVLLEAAARGIPAISSDCKVGPSEIITPGENGWLFPVGDVNALTGLMQRIVDDRSVLPNASKVAALIRRFGSLESARKFRDAIRQVVFGGAPEGELQQKAGSIST